MLAAGMLAGVISAAAVTVEFPIHANDLIPGEGIATVVHGTGGSPQTGSTSQTFPLHGPFAASVGFKLVPRHPAKPDIEFSDEPGLIGPQGKQPTATPAPRDNEPADSSIAAGDIPKVFEGFAVDGTSLETRDLQIAASHTHVVISSYHQLTFWKRDGTLLSDLNTVDFFGPVKDDMNQVLKDPADATKMLSAQYPINEFYDTRVIFDTYRNRFWIVSLTRNMSPGSSDAAHRVTLSSIAVSKTENPQDGWYTYWMPPCRDYQAIGVSKKLFVVGYSSGINFPEYGFMSVLDPEPLIKGLAGQKVRVLGGFKNPDGTPASAYMQPALQYGESARDLQFFVSNQGDGKTNVVWAIDPLHPTELIQVAVPITSSIRPKAAQQAGNADIPHPQLVWPVWGGSTPPLSGPDTIMKAIYRNNKLYWVWDDSIPGDSRQLRFIRLNRVDVSNFPVYLLNNKGTPSIDRRFGKRNAADPPSDVFSYYMPALAVNKDGTMVITYGRSGATIWPQTRYSVYFEKDSDIRPSQLLRKGDYPIGTEDPSYADTPANRQPGGVFDYNAAAVDPFDDRSVWTVNVYATKKSVGTGQYSLLVRRIPFNSSP